MSRPVWWYQHVCVGCCRVRVSRDNDLTRRDAASAHHICCTLVTVCTERFQIRGNFGDVVIPNPTTEQCDIIGLKNDLTCNLLFIWIHWIKSIALLITFSFKKTRATSAALLAQIWIYKTTENKISTIAPRQYGPEMVPLVWCTHQWNHNDECSGWNVSWKVLLRAMFWVLNSICD